VSKGGRGSGVSQPTDHRLPPQPQAWFRRYATHATRLVAVCALWSVGCLRSEYLVEVKSPDEVVVSSGDVTLRPGHDSVSSNDGSLRLQRTQEGVLAIGRTNHELVMEPDGRFTVPEDRLTRAPTYVHGSIATQLYYHLDIYESGSTKTYHVEEQLGFISLDTPLKNVRRITLRQTPERVWLLLYIPAALGSLALGFVAMGNDVGRPNAPYFFGGSAAFAAGAIFAGWPSWSKTVYEGF
jgi:hypothetical protein